jgi:inner membrane protein
MAQPAKLPQQSSALQRCRECNMNDIIPLTGPWFWWIVAGVLLLAEMAMPGFFMLWLAVAAALTALADIIFHFSWMGEVLSFAGFSLLTILASWRFVMGNRHTKSDSPHLNQKHNAFVGKTYALSTAIKHGSGKIKVEDALWDVDGEDAEAGARVKVVGVEGLRLRVERA